MNEINRFKVFILYSGDVTADVDQLYVKRIHSVSFYRRFPAYSLHLERKQLQFHLISETIRNIDTTKNTLNALFFRTM
jgi:hypothetical protein